MFSQSHHLNLKLLLSILNLLLNSLQLQAIRLPIQLRSLDPSTNSSLIDSNPRLDQQNSTASDPIINKFINGAPNLRNLSSSFTPNITNHHLNSTLEIEIGLFKFANPQSKAYYVSSKSLPHLKFNLGPRYFNLLFFFFPLLQSIFTFSSQKIIIIIGF